MKGWSQAPASSLAPFNDLEVFRLITKPWLDQMPFESLLVRLCLVCSNHEGAEAGLMKKQEISAPFAYICPLDSQPKQYGSSIPLLDRKSVV